MQNATDLYEQPSSYSALDFVIGLLVTLGASVFNSAGLNITKLDFVRQEMIPPSQRRPDFLRPYWVLGLILYIASQVLGSTLALAYLPSYLVAPLGSTSLIFNFCFAYLLVGTAITRIDIIGTLVIVVGVVGVVCFGNIKSDDSFDDNNLSLSLLKEIWGRSEWIGYIIGLEIASVLFWMTSTITNEVMTARVSDDRGENDRDGSGLEQMMEGGGGRRLANPYEGEGFWGKAKAMRQAWHRRQGKVREAVKGQIGRWSATKPEVTIRKVAGFSWAVTGGLLSGQTLVLAKSAVKLVTSAIHKSDPNESNQFTSPLTWLIIVLLVVTAVAQVYALNAALKCFDSTFVIPVFFASYTTSGFINTLVYLDQTKAYKTWVFSLVWVSIVILIIGVALLSSKPPPPKTRTQRTGSVSGGANPFDDPSYELDSPVKPGFAKPDVADVEAAIPAGTGTVPPEERKRGQGLLSRLFGGLPDAPAPSAVPRVGGSGQPSAATTAAVGAGAAVGRTRSTGGRDDDSVFASARGSQAGVDEVELDEVDRLGYDNESVRSGRTGKGDDDEFGDFERATGATRVDDLK